MIRSDETRAEATVRVLMLSVIAAFALSACISLDSAYDDRATRECERETSSRERGGCLDRVDDNRRAREN